MKKPAFEAGLVNQLLESQMVTHSKIGAPRAARSTTQANLFAAREVDMRGGEK